MKRVLATMLALVLGAPSGVAAAGVAGAQWREWSFTSGRSVHDGIVTLAPGSFHLQLEYWDFPDGDFQFRPELGVHVRDGRRSVYTVQWRHEREAHHFWLGTEQVLAGGWVGRAEASPIFRSGSTDWGWDAGADYYWGSYHFASASMVRDPREGGLWTVPLRMRLATERNDWLQLTLAPASRRTLGWALDGKWRLVRAGLERNRRFDFTEQDNVVLTLGVEVAWAGRR